MSQFRTLLKRRRNAYGSWISGLLRKFEQFEDQSQDIA